MLNTLKRLTVREEQKGLIPLASISEKPCFHYSPMKNLTIEPTSEIEDIMLMKAVNCIV